MFCAKCGSEIKDTAKFCPNCGATAAGPVISDVNMPPSEDVNNSNIGEKKKFTFTKEAKQRKEIKPETQKELRLITLTVCSMMAAVLPYIIRIIKCVTSQNVLSTGFVHFSNIAGWFVAFLLGLFLIKLYKSLNWVVYCEASLCIALSILLQNYYVTMWNDKVLGMVFKNIVIYVLITVAVMLVTFILGIFPILLHVKSFAAKLKVFFAGLVICTFVELISYGLDYIFALFKESFILTVSIYVIEALMMTLLAYIILGICEKNGMNNVTDSERIDIFAPFKKINIIILAVALVAGIVVTFVVSPEYDDVSTVYSDVYVDLEKASIYMLADDMDLALKYYKNVQAKRNAWEYLCGDKEDTEYSDEEVLKLNMLELNMMVWEKNRDIDGMAHYLARENYSLEIGKHYLDMRKGKSKPESIRSAENDELIDTIVAGMIAGDDFTIETMKYEDLKECRADIRDELDGFRDIDKYIELFSDVASMERRAEVDIDHINKLLDIAEQDPENIYVQYIAYSYGVLLKDDSKSHYGRVADAIKRFVDLYNNQYGISEDIIILAAQKLVEVDAYPAAIEYLQEVKDSPEYGSAAKSVMQYCYYKQDNIEDCAKISEEILSEDPENIEALYYVSVCDRKEKDQTALIKHLNQIFDVIHKLEGEDKYNAEVVAYGLLQQTVGNDGIFNGLVYKLSEEEEKIVNNNPLFSNYYNAMRIARTERGDELKEALALVDKIISSEGDMPCVYYLKGNICMKNDDFEGAVEAYEKCISMKNDSATIWYALANAYDALGDYEKSLSASKRSAEIMSSTDHDYDPFGVAIHNGWMMDRLKNKVEE